MKSKQVLCILASVLFLNFTSATASCDAQYEQSIGNINARIDQLKPEEAKNEKIRAGLGIAGGVASTVLFMAIAPYGLSNIPVGMEGAGLSGGPGGLAGFASIVPVFVPEVSSSIGDKYFGTTDEFQNLLIKSQVLMGAYKLIKEGAAGEGEQIQSSMMFIWDKTGKHYLSQKDVADKIVALDQEQAFCQKEDVLDTRDGVLEKVIRSFVK